MGKQKNEQKAAKRPKITNCGLKHFPARDKVYKARLNFSNKFAELQAIKIVANSVVPIAVIRQVFKLASFIMQTVSSIFPSYTVQGGLMKLVAILIGSLGVIMVATAPAFPMDQSKALKEIELFADHVCQTAPVKSKTEELQLSGNAKVQLKGLLSKISDLGINVSTQYKKNETEGVLQKDLALLLSKSADCKQKISAKLIDKLIASVNPSNEATTQQSVHNLKPLLKAQQERLLALINSYQAELGARKLIVDRHNGTLYFDDPQRSEPKYNFMKDIYGSMQQSNAGLFEELMESMPPEYVRFFPEARFGNPFVISITEEGKLYLNENSGIRKLGNNPASEKNSPLNLEGKHRGF